MKLVPEGIEGRVPYKGTLAAIVYQLVGGLRPAWATSAARTLDELHSKARSCGSPRPACAKSHVHDVIITKEAPNYRLEHGSSRERSDHV